MDAQKKLQEIERIKQDHPEAWRLAFLSIPSDDGDSSAMQLAFDLMDEAASCLALGLDVDADDIEVRETALSEANDLAETIAWALKQERGL